MIRSFCDICRHEFSNREEFAQLQMTSNLYNGVVRSETTVFHKKDNNEDNPWMAIMGRSSENILQLEMCIECLRKIVALREHITLLYKDKQLG